MRFKTHALIISLVAVGCAKPNNSTPNYGFLATSKFSSYLTLTPSDMVLVCGDDSRGFRKSALQAVRTWSAAAGRNGLRVVDKESCTGWEHFRAGIRAATNGNGCGGSVLGYNRRLDEAGFHASIVVCPLGWGQLGGAKAIMLHEVGHSFGLCDQYPSRPGQPWISFHDNCRSYMKSTNANYSIMNGGSSRASETLTEDDIVALRLFSCRTDIPANQVWLAQLGVSVNSWRTPLFNREMARLEGEGVYRFHATCKGAPTPTANMGRCEALMPKISLGPISGGYRSLRARLLGEDGVLMRIKEVRYRTHPSFPYPEVVTSSRPNFEAFLGDTFSWSGWKTGETTVTWHDGSSCDLAPLAVKD